MKLFKRRFENTELFSLCVLGFIINFAACYPGFISPDTISQYEQAVNNYYDTWHPPIMAYTWHLLNYISHGPQLMLALQLVFLWASCFLFASVFKNVTWRISLIALFLLAPFIQNFAGWIVKDTVMALSWLLAVAILFHKLKTNNSSVLMSVLAALCLLYGSWMRYNAITALPALAIMWAWVVFKHSRKGIKIASAVALTLIIYFGQHFFNNTIVKAQKNYTEIQIYFHDIAGVYTRSGKNFFPASMYQNPDFDTNYIRTHYNPVDVTKLLWNPDNKRVLVFNKENTEDLKKAWFHLLKTDPVEYVKLRYHIYLYFLTIKKESDLQYYFIWIQPNNYGFKLDDSVLYRGLATYISDQHGMLYFQVWFWILLNILLFPAALIIRNNAVKLYYICLVASGFLYTLPQLMVANTVRDFRYIYWSCLACTIAVIVLLCERFYFRNRSAITVEENIHN